VAHEGGDYRVKSYEHLLSAWQAQAEKEGAEDEAEAEEQASHAPEETGPDASATTADTSEGAASPTPQSTSTDEDKPSPIVTQREKIAGFMKHHEQLAANHPFATPFPDCSPQTIETALNLFMENSLFNGDLSRNKCRSYPDDVRQLWAALEGKKRFPLSELVSCGRVMRELF
jgi:hypothetical protein